MLPKTVNPLLTIEVKIKALLASSFIIDFLAQDVIDMLLKDLFSILLVNVLESAVVAKLFGHGEKLA